jgi:hypothetical protein
VVLDAVFDCGADHTLRFQEQQVCVRLRHGEHLIERIEVAQRTLVPSPPELSGNLVRRAGAGRDGRGSLPESDAVMVEKFVDALVNARSDGTVRGQQHGVVSSAH